MPPEKRQDMKVTDDMLIQFQNQNVAGLPRLKMTRAHCQSVRWDLARELTVIVPYVRTRATA